MVPPVILWILLYKLPESPYWLIQKGQLGQAKRALQFFRGKNYDISSEFNEIRKKELEKMEISKHSKTFILSRFFSPAFWKPFSCIGTLYFLHVFDGFTPLIVYLVTFINETGSNFDPHGGPVYLGLFRIFMALMAPFISRIFSPKNLFIGTFCMHALGMASLAIMIYLKANHPDLGCWNIISWIPTVILFILFLLRAIGVLPVLHTLIAELFPTEIRTQSIGITEAICLACGAMVVKLFPNLKETFGLFGLCCIYFFIAVIMIIWGAFTIPDNRGKSLVKVEEMYGQAKKIDPEIAK